MKDFKLLLASLGMIAGTLPALAQTPTVTTDTRFARGATMAFGRCKVTASGTTIEEQGFCWSEKPEPTIDDNKTTEYLENNGRIYWMKNLKPATIYYARPYAKATNGNVGYGEELKIVTIPKGTIRYSIRDGGEGEIKDRITNAVKEAIETYWNNLTSIKNFAPSVGYASGTQTADCSYGGWMRVGPNVSYQRTGTIMHEMLHGVGVIPWADTEWSRHNLRSGVNGDGYGSGYWLGDRVTEFLQFWDNNTTSRLNGDYQHMWPYGINGAQEDNGSAALYLGCSMVCQALGEDGLQHTSSEFAQPYYSVDFDSDKKYYLKNENPDFGLYSGYLIEGKNKQLTWKAMTAEEAAANDSAAWYLSFTPSNQYYQLRNAATGNYITYSSGFKTVARTTPTANENLHVMKGRVDVTLGSGNDIYKGRGFWLIHPTTNWTPPALIATKTSTSNQNFNIANSATQQRWLILEEDQLSLFDRYGTAGTMARFNARLDGYKKLLEVPYTATADNVTTNFSSAISLAETDIQKAKTPNDITNVEAGLITASMEFLENVTLTDVNQPFDLTFRIANADFADESLFGWDFNHEANVEGGVVELGDQTYHFFQDIPDVPIGNYKLEANAFQQPGTTDAVYADYLAGTDNTSAHIYVVKAITRENIKNIMADRQTAPLCTNTEDETQLADGTYIPATGEGAAAYFAQGLYKNTVIGNYPRRTSTPFRIGGRSTKRGDEWWSAFSDFHLYFYGQSEVPSAIDNIHVDANVNANATYSLTGQRQDPSQRLPRGIYIRNGKKLFIK